MNANQCDACGDTAPIAMLHEFAGYLCDRCAYRQDERDEFGYGLSASTFGFLGEDE